MFIVNTITRQILNDKTFAIDNLNNLQKMTFALYDDQGKAVFSQNDKFRLTVADLFTDYQVTAIDDNKVSFRAMNWLGKLTSSTTVKNIQVQKLVNGVYEDVVIDTITITADVVVIGTDVSDTTAVASDVVYGKVFHVANGDQTTGNLDIDASKIMYGKTIGSVSGTATQYDSAYAGDILMGRQAHARGQSITGTIPLKGGQTYTPGTSNQTIASGVYLSGDQVIQGDSDLVASNIKKDVEIFGVTGTYQGGSVQGILKNHFKSAQVTQYQVIPSTLTSSWTDFSLMFESHSALTTIPSIDTSNGTNFKYMFQKCGAATIPSIDTSNGTDFSYMFKQCTALTTIPSLNTSNGIVFSYMFRGCTALTSVPTLDLSKATSCDNMFAACSALKTVGQVNAANSTDSTYMFAWCSNLETIASLDVSKTSKSMMFYQCYALKNITFTGVIGSSIDFGTSSQLTHDSLMSIINHLKDMTEMTTQTLTLGSTNLAKLTDEQKAIATAKNWTLA